MGSGALAPHMGLQAVEWNWHVLVEGNQSHSLRLFLLRSNISKHAGPYFTAKWVFREATQSGYVITRLRKEDTSGGAEKKTELCVYIAIIDVNRAIMWSRLEFSTNRNTENPVISFLQELIDHFTFVIYKII